MEREKAREKVREKVREKAKEKKALVEYMKAEDNVWVVKRERVKEEVGLCGRRMFVESERMKRMNGSSSQSVEKK